MKAHVVHALTAVAAFVLAMVIGYAVQPAAAAPIVAPGCEQQSVSPAPPIPMPMARGHLVAI